MLVDRPIIGQLSVTWQTPYDPQYYQTRHLLHGLLTQDGEGTLVRTLKTLDLIQNLITKTVPLMKVYSNIKSSCL